MSAKRSRESKLLRCRAGRRKTKRRQGGTAGIADIGFRPQFERLEDRWLLAADGMGGSGDFLPDAYDRAYEKLAPLGEDLGWTTTSEIAHLFETEVTETEVTETAGPAGATGLSGAAIAAASGAPQGVNPAGSLVYVSDDSGDVSIGGEVDTFLIDVDVNLYGGQSITVVVDPDGSLQPTIELLDPGSSSLGTSMAVAAGDDIVLQTLATTGAGTYSVTVTGNGGSTGDYSIQIILNAAVEAEEHDGASNDLAATAQDLDATFVSLGGGSASRGAVVGSGSDGIGIAPPPLATPSEADLFYNPTTGELFLDSADAPNSTFTGYVLKTPESPGFVEENHVPFLGGVGLTSDEELSEANFFASAGLFNIGAVMPTDLDQAGLEAFFDVSIYTGQLGLGVSNFDFVMLDVPQTVDLYSFNLTASQSASLALGHSGGGVIAVELLDSTGNVLASGAGADNVDQIINDFVAPLTGTFYARVTSNVLEYTLVVTRDAVFDAESNDSLTGSQDLGTGGVALGALDGSDDFYHLSVTAGDVLSIETTTPSDGPFAFVNNLDPAIELVDPSGAVVGSDDNGAGDGHNGLLGHVALQTGTYTVRVSAMAATTGEYVLEVSGQNGVAAAFEVTSTDPTDGETRVAPFSEITVDLSDTVVLSTVDAADLTVDGTPATAVTVIDADTLRFTLPALADGLHNVSIAAGALSDLQNQPIAAFASQFTLDTVGPRVINATIQEGDSVSAGTLIVGFVFDIELDATNLDASDVQLVGQHSGTHTPISFGYNSFTSTLTLSYDSLPDDAFQLTLTSGDEAFEDLMGRDLDGEPLAFPLPPNVSGDGVVGGDFVVNFVTDQGVLPFPVPLEAVEPLGSQVYQGEALATIRTAGDADSFTIDVDAGQVITVVVDGESSLQATVELRDPGNTLIGSATAVAVGEDVVLQTAAAASSGTYTVTIAGAGATTGDYKVQFVLNAAVEEESHDGPVNDTLATAQDLNLRFVSLGLGTAERAAVLGTSDASANFFASLTEVDTVSNPNDLVFEFAGATLPAGDGVLTFLAIADLDRTNEFITINAEGLFTQNLFMSGGLQGELVTTTVNISHADLVALAADGTITIDVDPNSQVNLMSSDELTVELTYPTYPATSDLYSFSLAAGELASLALSARTPGHVSLELLDAAGNLLTTGAVGTNVDQVVDSFITALGGTYYARVSGNVADYNLVVAREADFDTEPNNGLGAFAQDLTANGRAFGGLFDGDVEPGRSFGLIQDSLPWSLASNNAILEELGHNVTLISSADLGTIDLTTFDVVVLASDQDSDTYGNVATSIAAIESYVSGGGVWVVNYAAGDIDLPYTFDVFPGAAAIEVEAGIGSDIDVRDATSGLIDGPGGTITDMNLDGGFWAFHGATTSVLPSGGNAILSTDDPSEVVAFDYPLGSGYAIVHTIPIEFYGGGPSAIGETFHRNLFNYAASLASEVADYYRLEVVAGDSLSVQTFVPASASSEFVNELDIAAEMYDPSGVLVASSATGASAHVAASTGTYTVKVLGEADSRGEYVVEVSGHSGTLPLFEVIASDPADEGRVGVDTIEVTIDLSDAVLLTSVTAADLVIDGSVSAASFYAADHDTLVFQLPALSDGLHTVEIMTGAMTDLQGQLLEAFDFEFTVDTIAPKVIASSILEGGTVSARSLTVTLEFDEELASESLNTFDVPLVGQASGGHLPLAFDYDALTSTLTLEYINLPADEFTITLLSGDGSFEDLVGHDLDGEPDELTTVPSGDDEAGGDFVVNFTNEYVSVPMPELLHAEAPRGSLIHDSVVLGAIGEPGDMDSFTLDLDAGQLLTIVVESSSGLQASVALDDPSMTLIGTATAAAASDDAVIQTVAIATAGTYAIQVSGAAGTTGDYSVQVILNAAAEDEAHGGTTNDDIFSAQDLEASFVGLGFGLAERGAVVGQGGSDGDLFEFNLLADQSATLALSARLAGGLGLELLDAGGIVLAVGSPANGNNVGQLISNYVATIAGTYFARIVGVLSDYSLVVTRGADFDTESNNSLATAQTIGAETTALGYLIGEPSSEALEGPEPLGAAESADSPSPIFDHEPNDSADAIPGRLIVRFNDTEGLDVAAAVAALGGTVIQELPLIDAVVVQVAPSLLAGTLAGGQLPTANNGNTGGGQSSSSTAALLEVAGVWQSHDSVVYAEPDYILQTQTVPLLPSDLNVTALWGMHNTGQTGGTVDADIDAPEAWANFTGTTQVVIASIDTGVDYTHEDLAANMWQNLAELNGVAGEDDDGNGHIDDFYGIDTANDDSDPFDDNGHGTHTAGTFGAVGNNGVGVVGVNWDIQIMALKFLGSNGNGSITDAVKAITYMTMMKTDYGVNIVASNNSWSGGSFSEPLHDAIEASNEAGIMFVAAAANLAGDNDEFAEYPSSFDFDGIISVAATDDNDSLASFSNYGATTVDLAAPGVFIWSTEPGDSYGYSSGTSMAAPHVAGAVAMLMASNPDATLAEVKNAILSGVDLVESLDGLVLTGGRLNLANSLTLLGDAGDYFQIDVVAGDALSIVTATPSDGPNAFINNLDPFIELYDPSGSLMGANDNGAGDGVNALLNHTALTSGTYTVRVASSGGAGTYVVDIAVAPRVLVVEVNEKAHLSVSSIEGAADGIKTIDVSFNRPVVFSAGDVLVQTVTFSGNVETVTGTLSPLTVLGSGSDTLTLSFAAATVTDTWVKVTLLADGIASVKNVALDGDAPVGGSGQGYLANATDLPSGDGASGGNGIFFVGSLVGDTNGDALVDIGGDILPAFAAYTGSVGAAGGRTLADGDIDEDGDVDVSDLLTMFAAYGNQLDDLPTLLSPSPLFSPLASPLASQLFGPLLAPSSRRAAGAAWIREDGETGADVGANERQRTVDAVHHAAGDGDESLSGGDISEEGDQEGGDLDGGDPLATDGAQDTAAVDATLKAW